jgi:hypothetical protein
MNKATCKYLSYHICVCVIIFFITLFFPLYFSTSSPAVWIKSTLEIQSVQLKPPSPCVLGFHYALCKELQINLQFLDNNNLYDCNINVFDNVEEVYDFYLVTNLTSVPGYFSRITHQCREIYYEPYFVFGFLILNFLVFIFAIIYMYQKYKTYYAKLYNRNIEVLLSENKSAI